MEHTLRRLANFGALLTALAGSLRAADATPNELTPAESAAGWRLLFDGESLAGWRGFGRPAGDTTGWTAQDGWIRHYAGKKGPDLITEALFTNFVFVCEWRIAPGGNSGVKYFIDEHRGQAIGHEYQILDDEVHPDGKIGAHRRTGSLYDALPPHLEPGLLLAAGKTNVTEIRVDGLHVEHWLNGKRVLAYEIGSPELAVAKAKSKFKKEARWGTKFPTPILLQNHGDEIWFRSLRVRPLP